MAAIIRLTGLRCKLSHWAWPTGMIRADVQPGDYLIANAVGHIEPGAKGDERFVAHDLRHGDAAEPSGLRDLAENKGVVELRGGGVGGGGSIEYTRGARPINCSQTHRARFAASVKVTAIELKAGEHAAGLTNRDDFGVGSWIVRGCDAVHTFGERLAIFHYDCAKWAAAPAPDIFKCQVNGALHEGIVHLYDAFQNQSGC